MEFLTFGGAAFFLGYGLLLYFGKWAPYHMRKSFRDPERLRLWGKGEGKAKLGWAAAFALAGIPTLGVPGAIFWYAGAIAIAAGSLMLGMQNNAKYLK